MTPRLLAWLRPNLNLVGVFVKWHWSSRPSKLIFYIFTLCGMWIKIMREIATKYNLWHPNCIDVQYEQYQQCECLTNQHTGESELLCSKLEWGSQWFCVMFRERADYCTLVMEKAPAAVIGITSGQMWDLLTVQLLGFSPCLSVN